MILRRRRINVKRRTWYQYTLAHSDNRKNNIRVAHDPNKYTMKIVKYDSWTKEKRRFPYKVAQLWSQEKPYVWYKQTVLRVIKIAAKSINHMLPFSPVHVNQYWIINEIATNQQSWMLPKKKEILKRFWQCNQNTQVNKIIFKTTTNAVILFSNITCQPNLISEQNVVIKIRIKRPEFLHELEFVVN